MPKIILSSSILSANFANLAQEIQSAEQGGVDWIHVDVMDGVFVPNLTMGPFIVQTCHQITPLPLDVHLMIAHPEKQIQAFAQAGASILTVHIENTPHVHRILEQIHEIGCKAGIAINPGTPASAIEAIIPFIDHVLVMTVNPGYSGQEFIPGMVKKIAQVRNMLAGQNSSALIQVDGGISAQTIGAVVNAGARSIVAATSIFKFPQGITAGIAALRKAAS